VKGTIGYKVRHSKEVDAYIGQFPKETKRRLTAVREIIHKALPQAEETGAKTIEHFHDELSSFKSAKGSVQFPVALPLPTDLLTRERSRQT
jgi:uncharacterized protein YdhG (YjbR/CyaY superfamily)